MLFLRSHSLNVKHLLYAFLIFIGIYFIIYLAGWTSITKPRRPSWVGPVHVHENGHLPSEERLLPIAYWDHRKKYADRYTRETCCDFPSPGDIKYAATSWQHLPVANGSVYLYSAYWDDREEEAVVRLLIYSDVAPLPELYCFLWYEDDSNPVTVPISVTYGWLPVWGGPIPRMNEPYIISCRARNNNRPAAVSVSSKLCSNPRNALAVQGAQKTKSARPSPTSTSLGVCLKWLRYTEDVSGPLTEWIELLQALGVNTIYIYVLKVHPNMEKVLQYYEFKGIVQVQQHVHPPQLRADKFGAGTRKLNDLKRELLPLNDCLYRAVGSRELRWLGVFDLDELIVPVRDETYQDLISKEVADAGTPPDALVFQNYYFLDGAQREKVAPPPARILAHVWRSRKHRRQDWHVKSFISVNSVVAMHNHVPISCGDYFCYLNMVEEDVARLHHYRVRCLYDGSDTQLQKSEHDTENCTELHDVVRDDTMLRWSYVLPRVTQVLVDLDIPCAPYNDTVSFDGN